MVETETSVEVVGNKKRRRLSKKERKALKKKNKEGKKKHIANSIHNNSTNIIATDSKERVVDGGEQDEDQIEKEEECIRLECMKSYDPICITNDGKSIPEPNPIGTNKSNAATTTTATVDEETGARTLGKWFPNAFLIKACLSYTNTGKIVTTKGDSEKERSAIHKPVNNPQSSLVLFYQYTTSNDATDSKEDNEGTIVTSKSKMWDRQKLQRIITLLSKVARHRNLGGRIRIAPEGVNATVSAVDTSKCSAKAALRHFAEDLKRFDLRVFQKTDFKYFDSLPADRHFKECKILPVQELVFYDIDENEAPLNGNRNKNRNHSDTENDNNDDNDRTNKNENASEGGGEGRKGGIHLDAKEYHKMLQKKNTVVIDVRNHYETILGRFDGQNETTTTTTTLTTAKGTSSTAEYLDPEMRKSTDFKSWLATPETRDKLNNKTVLMYCTGGIRCERASAYLQTQMGDEVNGIYQLKGGIERYLKTFKDGGFWRGKNFVFDKREAVSVDNPHGDGGVIRKQDKKKLLKMNNSDSDSSKCCVCGCFWDRYVGKKKCLTCGVPVLMCDKCMSLKPDKTPGKELTVRCPLCVKENITVLAKELELTANGIKNKVVATKLGPELTDHNNNKRSFPGKKNESVGKAADSVLKWGGGHSIKKRQRKKIKRQPC